jgi:hypothetical protein
MIKGLKMIMDYKPPNLLGLSPAENVYSWMKYHKLTSPKKVGRCLEQVIFLFLSVSPRSAATSLQALSSETKQVTKPYKLISTINLNGKL